LSAAASSVPRAPACASGRDLRLNVVQRAPFPSLAPGSGGPSAPEHARGELACSIRGRPTHRKTPSELLLRRSGQDRVINRPAFGVRELPVGERSALGERAAVAEREPLEPLQSLLAV
jgi:hypothetical protein